MIKLVNGRGQLGGALSEIMNQEHINPQEEISIYHTWNFLDKSEKVQKECYERFVKYMEENPLGKTVFTSTYSQTENFYNYYKQLAEAHLLSNYSGGYVIRLPIIIGKGVFDKLRNNEIKAYGDMELITLRDAAREVLGFAIEKGVIRSRTIRGNVVPAKIAKELIDFGRDGKV